MGRKNESGKAVISKKSPFSFERVGNVNIVISWQYSHYCPTCGEFFGEPFNARFPKFCYECGEKLKWNLDNEPYANKEGREMIERIMRHEFINPEELKDFLESENVYHGIGGDAEDFMKLQNVYKELTGR